MEKEFYCASDGPIVKTRSGGIRGYIFDGIYTFHGIRYATAKRFMSPKPVEKWDGVKDALVYGHTAPVPTGYSIFDDFTVPHHFWPQSEDCLFLNIWTQHLESKAKKPVLFWIHGGGFYNGSSMEMPAYDGANMSRYGDVVIVSVNHRLNFLGYLDLSSYGKRYANSGNLGQEDLVEALKWVRDNIEEFGGDPDNVTIFGQSGGGAKVTALMQTPAANGLFHKAIVQSGVMGGSLNRPRKDREIVEAVLDQLGYESQEVDKLETVPLDSLQRAFLSQADDKGFAGIGFSFGPVSNDWHLGSPTEVGFSEHAKKIPVLVGSVLAEFMKGIRRSDMDSMSPEQRRAFIADEFGQQHADELIRLFKAAYPDKNEMYLSEITNRTATLDYCRLKAEASSAPVYNYLMTLIFPFNDGTPAWHCAEIPLVFHNALKIPAYHIQGVTEELQDKFCSAWVNFAYHGKPSGTVVGEWPAYKDSHEATYLFDQKAEVRIAHDKALMAYMQKNIKPKTPFG